MALHQLSGVGGVPRAGEKEVENAETEDDLKEDDNGFGRTRTVITENSGKAIDLVIEISIEGRVLIVKQFGSGGHFIPHLDIGCVVVLHLISGFINGD